MYASATVVVRKKDAEGNYTDFRQCGDYRPLNLETTLDRYPLPGIEDIVLSYQYHPENNICHVVYAYEMLASDVCYLSRKCGGPWLGHDAM